MLVVLHRDAPLTCSTAGYAKRVRFMPGENQVDDGVWAELVENFVFAAIIVEGILEVRKEPPASPASATVPEVVKGPVTPEPPSSPEPAGAPVAVQAQAEASTDHEAPADKRPKKGWRKK